MHPDIPTCHAYKSIYNYFIVFTVLVQVFVFNVLLSYYQKDKVSKIMKNIQKERELLLNEENMPRKNVNLYPLFPIYFEHYVRIFWITDEIF